MSKKVKCCECDSFMGYNLKVVDKDGGELMYFKNDIGNSIFLTREEAVNKLEEMKNE